MVIEILCQHCICRRVSALTSIVYCDLFIETLIPLYPSWALTKVYGGIFFYSLALQCCCELPQPILQSHLPTRTCNQCQWLQVSSQKGTVLQYWCNCCCLWNYARIFDESIFYSGFYKPLNPPFLLWTHSRIPLHFDLKGMRSGSERWCWNWIFRMVFMFDHY